jgi:UDP-glucose 4-epimerase
MRILVTGASGLIGSRVAQDLSNAGHTVRLGSRNSNLAVSRNQEFAPLDWNCQASLFEACRGMDAVVHAAGMNAKECTDNPLGALEFNGLGSARLAQAASRVGVSRLLYFSTAHVYANPLAGVFSEDDCPQNLHPYASSHLAGEYATRYAGQLSGMQVCVLRLSNAVGYPLNLNANCWGLLANDLCRQIIQHGSMQLATNGSQWRNFIPLTAVGSVVLQLLEKDVNLTAIGVLNLGGREMRVIEMANLIQRRAAALFGVPPPIVKPDRQSELNEAGLNYGIDRLVTLFPSLDFSFEAELDNLLLFCAAHFRVDGVSHWH